MKHTPTVGTVLSMTPAAGRVRFTTDAEEWTLPLIGWAVVVRWVSDPDEGDDTDEYETELDAAVLDDETGPMSLTWYLADRNRVGLRVTIEPSS